MWCGDITLVVQWSQDGWNTGWLRNRMFVSHSLWLPSSFSHGQTASSVLMYWKCDHVHGRFEILYAVFSSKYDEATFSRDGYHIWWFYFLIVNYVKWVQFVLCLNVMDISLILQWPQDCWDTGWLQYRAFESHSWWLPSSFSHGQNASSVLM